MGTDLARWEPYIPWDVPRLGPLAFRGQPHWLWTWGPQGGLASLCLFLQTVVESGSLQGQCVPGSWKQMQIRAENWGPRRVFCWVEALEPTFPGGITEATMPGGMSVERGQQGNEWRAPGTQMREGQHCRAQVPGTHLGQRVLALGWGLSFASHSQCY